MSLDRRPYRKIGRVVAVHNGKVLAQKAENHLILPGGGVDEGETPEAAARREALEETGAVLGDLTLFQVVRVDWTRAWANTPKRKQRFRQFRGEEEHIFIGKVKSFVKPTSSEGDAWSGSKTMAMKSALAHCESTFGMQTAEFKVLMMAKMCAIRALQLMQL